MSVVWETKGHGGWRLVREGESPTRCGWNVRQGLDRAEPRSLGKYFRFCSMNDGKALECLEQRNDMLRFVFFDHWPLWGE